MRSSPRSRTRRSISSSAIPTPSIPRCARCGASWRAANSAALGMIAGWNYTNFLYRPRRPEELDTARGGGILFNQVPHQIDMVRTIGGGRLRSVRAQVDTGSIRRGRPKAARPRFSNSKTAPRLRWSMAATIIFDSDELHFWINERGAQQTARSTCAPRAARLCPVRQPKRSLRVDRYAYGADAGPPPAHQPHFGVMVVTCARRRNARLRRWSFYL